jgi:leucyl-tRNA synthetase
LDFIKKLNFERISIKTLITLIDYTIVVTSNSSKLIGTYVYNRNNVVDEFISAYNKLAKTNKINEDSTFQQVFLNPILIERIHPTFTPYISNINLRGENMND